MTENAFISVSLYGSCYCTSKLQKKMTVNKYSHLLQWTHNVLWKSSYSSLSSFPNLLSSPSLGNQDEQKKEFFRDVNKIKNKFRASLVEQWLRICLLMQGTWVRALVWEDPTCRGATRPVSHNYWACASGACAPQQERPR